MTQSALDTALTHMLGQTRIQVTTAPIWRIMHIKTKQDTSASPEQNKNPISIYNATIEVPPPVMLVPKRLASNSNRVQSQDAHRITSQPDQPEQSREQLASKSDQVQSQDATNNGPQDEQQDDYNGNNTKRCNNEESYSAYRGYGERDDSQDGEDGDNSHESEHDRDYRERGDSDNDEGNHQHIPSTNKRRGRKKSSSGKARRDCSRESTRAKSSPLPLPVPLPTTQLLGDLPEAELDDVQDTAEGLADDIENGEDIEGLLVKIATAKLNNTEAGVRAMLAPPEFWRSAAHKFGISAVNRLLQQANSPERYIPMPAEFSFAPKLGLMAHQAVGIDRFQELVFGPSGGAVLADLMGLVETVQIELSPVQRPELGNENQFKGRKPRLSATVLSAYASGVEPWLREFKLVFGGSRIMKSTPKTWQLKMLVLHPKGDTLCKKYGGEENGLDIVNKKADASDGEMKHQAKRSAMWPSGKKTQRKVDFVYNGLYAAWVIADEIHSIGGQSTITHSHVFDHFRTAAATDKILTFALKTFLRKDRE
ncbi:hypothetical protein PTTW11_01497 [Pyrenophora teres f. teres]|uniref:Uncharacterized protein n=1 Tax=Pyrenophora teres f. teres TaxID=97479 RepID=A0A6S6VF02_9PLEO|nr:hypothetical protein PTTW11_01497 [Pyrenophora teres f. teres]